MLMENPLYDVKNSKDLIVNVQFFFFFLRFNLGVQHNVKILLHDFVYYQVEKILFSVSVRSSKYMCSLPQCYWFQYCTNAIEIERLTDRLCWTSCNSNDTHDVVWIPVSRCV